MGNSSMIFFFFWFGNNILISVNNVRALWLRMSALPRQSSKTGVTLVCSAGMSLLWRYEAEQ